MIYYYYMYLSPAPPRTTGWQGARHGGVRGRWLRHPGRIFWHAKKKQTRKKKSKPSLLRFWGSYWDSNPSCSVATWGEIHSTAQLRCWNLRALRIVGVEGQVYCINTYKYFYTARFGEYILQYDNAAAMCDSRLQELDVHSALQLN
jgi:hypothetical protein